MDRSLPPPGTDRRGAWAAWLAHAYTASGTVIAFFALTRIVAGDLRSAFLWLFCGVIVDATDGWVARHARVYERLPWFNGAHLDDLVDYVSYVFVPAFLLYHAGRLPRGWELLPTSAMLLASAYGFSRSDAKTADHFFTGFPSYWNIVAFYLYAAGTPGWFNAAVLLALSAFVFLPLTYVYPSRTRTLRPVTLLFGTIWGMIIFALVWHLPFVSRPLLVASLAFPAYYAVISVALNRRRWRD